MTPTPPVVAAAPETELSPTGKAIIPQNLVRYAVAAIAVAAVVHQLPDFGFVLPAIVVKIDNMAMAIGVLLGLTSQGVRVIGK
jgi:hypothetical protein